MRDGDIMTVEVEGIGRLENPCREVRHLQVRPA
jgi:2-keto-4-pentenoate hydratase/2-oxohepta-3-ene-1,7-dioic acid hydratase in catechol pathway